MKVLFVSSGNSEQGISTVVKNQGESLRDQGIDIQYYNIVGKGVAGYLKNVLPLRRYVNKNRYDIIHSHYSLSAFTATLSGCKPLVVSLMGSDIRLGSFVKWVIKICSLLFWNVIIVKSKDMLDSVGIKSVEIIPNGVNVFLFKPRDKKSAQKKLGWDSSFKHILFAADPLRPEKNFQLLQEAYDRLKSRENIVLHSLKDIPREEIPAYMNASDVVLLTSLWEGSPNVIKEAMACNRPVVCTDVGDVRLIFGDTPGCFLVSFDSADVVEKLKTALSFAETYHDTKGRNRILDLGLDAESIARRIIDMYKKVIKN